MKDSGKSWKYTRAITSFGTKNYFTTIQDGSGDDIRIYKHENVIFESIKDLMKKHDISEKECYVKYFDKIFRDTNAQSSIRTRVIDATAGVGDFFSIEYTPKTGRSKGKLSTLYYKGNNCDLIAWLSDISEKRGNKIVKKEKAGTFWDGFPLKF